MCVVELYCEQRVPLPFPSATQKRRHCCPAEVCGELLLVLSKKQQQQLTRPHTVALFGVFVAAAAPMSERCAGLATPIMGR